MMRYAWLSVLVLAVAVASATSGCGKSGSGSAPPPPKPKSTAGQPPAPLSSSVGMRSGKRTGLLAVDAKYSNKLMVPFDAANATGMSTSNGGVSEGRIEVQPQTSPPANGGISTLAATPGHTILQIEIVEDQAKSLYGKTVTMATSVTGIFVKDSKGSMFNPKGYVLNRPDKSQQMHLVPMSLGGISRPTEIPYKGMPKANKIFVIFEIPTGTKLTTFQVGETTQDLNLPEAP